MQSTAGRPHNHLTKLVLWWDSQAAFTGTPQAVVSVAVHAPPVGGCCLAQWAPVLGVQDKLRVLLLTPSSGAYQQVHSGNTRATHMGFTGASGVLPNQNRTHGMVGDKKVRAQHAVVFDDRRRSRGTPSLVQYQNGKKAE